MSAAGWNRRLMGRRHSQESLDVVGTIHLQSNAKCNSADDASLQNAAEDGSWAKRGAAMLQMPPSRSDASQGTSSSDLSCGTIDVAAVLGQSSPSNASSLSSPPSSTRPSPLLPQHQRGQAVQSFKSAAGLKRCPPCLAEQEPTLASLSSPSSFVEFGSNGFASSTVNQHDNNHHTENQSGDTMLPLPPRLATSADRAKFASSNANATRRGLGLTSPHSGMAGGAGAGGGLKGQVVVAIDATGDATALPSTPKVVTPKFGGWNEKKTVKKMIMTKIREEENLLLRSYSGEFERRRAKRGAAKGAVSKKAPGSKKEEEDESMVDTITRSGFTVNDFVQSENSQHQMKQPEVFAATSPTTSGEREPEGHGVNLDTAPHQLVGKSPKAARATSQKRLVEGEECSTKASDGSLDDEGRSAKSDNEGNDSGSEADAFQSTLQEVKLSEGDGSGINQVNVPVVPTTVRSHDDSCSESNDASSFWSSPASSPERPAGDASPIELQQEEEEFALPSACPLYPSSTPLSLPRSSSVSLPTPCDEVSVSSSMQTGQGIPPTTMQEASLPPPKMQNPRSTNSTNWPKHPEGPVEDSKGENGAEGVWCRERSMTEKTQELEGRSCLDAPSVDPVSLWLSQTKEFANNGSNNPPPESKYQWASLDDLLIESSSVSEKDFTAITGSITKESLCSLNRVEDFHHQPSLQKLALGAFSKNARVEACAPLTSISKKTTDSPCFKQGGLFPKFFKSKQVLKGAS